MKSQVLNAAWCNISGEGAGKILSWSLLLVKGLTELGNYVGAAEDKLVYQLSVDEGNIDAVRETMADVSRASPSLKPPGGRGTPIYFLGRDVPTVRVSFSGSSVLNRVYIFRFSCLEQGRPRKSSPFLLRSHNFRWFRAPSLKCVKSKLMYHL